MDRGERMPNVVVIGAQWGDEGKGKIVDLFTRFADVVVRFQGGPNAGHTLVVDGRKTVLHQIPSGILHAGKLCLVGNGVVLDPETLVREIDEVKAQGFLADDAQLRVSPGAHVIMPYHRLLDRAREKARVGGAIGTTGRGIGPCYEDKVARRGIRVGDLVQPEKLGRLVADRLVEANAQLSAYGEATLNAAELTASLAGFARRIAPHVGDTSIALARESAAGKAILFEGAQGTLLDVDHGTYPFVTSSNTTAAAAATGAGIGPRSLHEVIGISKAYATRVGSGPFPTELDDAMGERLRETGDEFGATTGRPRRCGWLDTVILRYAARVNGLTGVALTKLDVLTGIDPIRICVAYELDGERIDALPTDTEALARVRPIYEEHAGWTKTLEGLRRYEDLPQTTRRYIARVEELTGVEVVLVSVGADREETIIRRNPFRS
jgi:adenylosuccinate synthase